MKTANILFTLLLLGSFNFMLGQLEDGEEFFDDEMIEDEDDMDFGDEDFMDGAVEDEPEINVPLNERVT